MTRPVASCVRIRKATRVRKKGARTTRKKCAGDERLVETPLAIARSREKDGYAPNAMSARGGPNQIMD